MVIIKYLYQSKIPGRKSQRCTANAGKNGVKSPSKGSSIGQRFMTIQSKIHIGECQRFAKVQVNDSQFTEECSWEIHGK